jgi:hypothetical protein
MQINILSGQLTDLAMALCSMHIGNMKQTTPPSFFIHRKGRYFPILSCSAAQQRTVIRPPDKRPHAPNLIHATQKNTLRKTLLPMHRCVFFCLRKALSRRVRHWTPYTAMARDCRIERLAITSYKLQLRSGKFLPSCTLSSKSSSRCDIQYPPWPLRHVCPTCGFSALRTSRSCSKPFLAVALS